MIGEQRQHCRKEATMPTAPKVLDLAESRDAPFVMASLVSSGITRGGRPFVPRRASIASELGGPVTAIGCPGSKSPYTKRSKTVRGLHDDSSDLATRQAILENSAD